MSAPVLSRSCRAAIGFLAVDPKVLTRLRRLLHETRILTLAVVRDGELVVGVMPFLAESDLRSLVIHTSRLAKHARGLTPTAPFSAAIHEPDRDDLDPLALHRLLVSGTVASVGEAERRRLEAAWVERFPSAVMTLGLGDFDFHRLRIETARLITGFAQAYTVGERHLAAAAALRSA